MKIMFVTYPLHLRYFQSALSELAARGHDVHLYLTTTKISPLKCDTAYADDLAAKHGITYELASGRTGFWWIFALYLRKVVDYSRYFDPVYDNAPKLKARFAARIPTFSRLVMHLVHRMPGLDIAASAPRFLTPVERAIPCDRAVESAIAIADPDILLVAPLVNCGSEQVDVVKVARRRGIPCALCVESWDNLSNKGLIRIAPDAVLLWNRFQEREAIAMHGIRADTIHVTGAQCFDCWFEKTPAISRASFCQTAGIGSDQPFLLYACSSSFIAYHDREIDLVERWIDAVRSHAPPPWNKAGILIRPHPQNAASWRRVDFSQYENVAIWETVSTGFVLDEQAQEDYFHSLYFCSGVVGLNTSVFIEAGILGRPVFTFATPEFGDTQAGTLHFHYLLEEGLLHHSESLFAHVDLLASVLDDSSASGLRSQRFVSEFVRPLGVDRPCTPRFADVIEEIGAVPAPAERSSFSLVLLRIVVLPFAIMASVSLFIRRMVGHGRLVVSRDRGRDPIPEIP